MAIDLPYLDEIQVSQAVAQDEQLAARNAFVLLTAVGHQRYQAAEAICSTLGVPLILKPFELGALLDAVAAAAHRVPSQP